MANETLTETLPCTSHYLPLADVDRAGTICRRIDAIADCMGEAVANSEALSDLSVPAICELIRDMVSELQGIVEQQVVAGNA